MLISIHVCVMCLYFSCFILNTVMFILQVKPQESEAEVPDLFSSSCHWLAQFESFNSMSFLWSDPQFYGQIFFSKAITVRGRHSTFKCTVANSLKRHCNAIKQVKALNTISLMNQFFMEKKSFIIYFLVVWNATVLQVLKYMTCTKMRKAQTYKLHI